MANRSTEDYAEMSRRVEVGEYTISGPLELGSTLRMGRPARGQRPGKSPSRTVRLPADLDDRLVAYADETHSTPSDVVRKAVAEYLTRHRRSQSA